MTDAEFYVTLGVLHERTPRAPWIKSKTIRGKYVVTILLFSTEGSVTIGTSHSQDPRNTTNWVWLSPETASATAAFLVALAKPLEVLANADIESGPVVVND